MPTSYSKTNMSHYNGESVRRRRNATSTHHMRDRWLPPIPLSYIILEPIVLICFLYKKAKMKELDLHRTAEMISIYSVWRQTQTLLFVPFSKGLYFIRRNIPLARTNIGRYTKTSMACRIMKKSACRTLEKITFVEDDCLSSCRSPLNNISVQS